MNEGKAYWDDSKEYPHLMDINNHADNGRWDMIAPMDWEYLARSKHASLTREDVQLIAVAKEPEVFQHLTNPSEKVGRLHALRWKI